MWAYIILGAIWVGLLIPVVRERRAWIAYAHGGTGLLFTSLLLSLELHQTGDIADIVWLEIIGFVLFIPAAILIASALVAIAQRNLVKTGMMRIVRHPMYLGTAIAAFALILVFQSILSIVLSIIAIVLLWMASKMEDDYNIERFGDSYRDHMTRVPRWNVFKGLRKE
ncbi:MAG TPA: methyltransferase [Desulfatiglandales bacterium]|nr:methyltransferase [Desulfatiglandales bacterium]